MTVDAENPIGGIENDNTTIDIPAVRRAPRRSPIAPRRPGQVLQVTPGSPGMPKWSDLIGIDPDFTGGRDVG